MPNLPERFCTGCSACAFVCAHGVIQMVPDRKGFVRPILETCKCRNCGACERVCPALRRHENISASACFAMRSKDENLLLLSSSGGLFSELANRVLDAGGVAFGCVLRDGVARHEIATSREELSLMRGSKYVQSDVGGTYRECRQALCEGKQVLYSGTPCQIAGLRSFLGREYDRLLTVGLICHGAGSPLILSRYLEEEGRTDGTRITDVEFRNKSKHSNCISMVLRTDGGCDIVYRNSFGSNHYMCAFLEAYSYRDCCFDCQFREGRSGADIILGDFWGIESIVPTLRGEDGVSAVLAFSEKGQRALSELDVWKLDVTFEQIASQNKNLIHNARPPRRIRQFWSRIQSGQSIREIMDEFHRPSLLRRIVGKAVRMTRKLQGRG